MPYLIKKINNGFKVCKQNDQNKCFSKKPMTKEMAKKQMRAIIMSEFNHNKGNYSMIKNSV